MTRKVQTAVVGAGVAGLYAASLLAAAGRDDLVVYEAAHRAGGCVLTVRHAGIDVDLGPHWLRDDHRLALGLAAGHRLELTVQARAGSCDFVQIAGTLRGRRQIRRAWLKPFPVAVAGRLQRRGVAALLRKGLAGSDAADFGAALRAGLDSAEMDHLRHRSGYDFWELALDAPATRRWVRDELLAASHGFVSVAGGMDRLAAAMALPLRGRLKTGHRLASLAPLPGGGTELAFAAPEGPLRVVADTVILALPPAAVLSIAPLAAMPAIRRIAGAAEPLSTVTGAVFYPSPFWRRGKGASGTVHTDGPLGIVFHIDGEAGGAIRFYAQGRSGAELRRGDLQPGAVEDAASAQTRFLDALVRRLHPDAPRPTASIAQDWNAEEGRAAYHLWRAGSDPEAVAATACRPIPGWRLHVCGEAWSNRHMWIEGALESARRAVDAVLQADQLIDVPDTATAAVTA